MGYLHRHVALSRKGFLALGASGVATAAAGALGPAAALAAPQPPAPQGDDLGFLAFGSVGEGASRAFYREALATPRLFDAGERATRPPRARVCSSRGCSPSTASSWARCTRWPARRSARVFPTR
jgi:hypothetical protein